MSMRVGFIGIGIMGVPMVRNLLKAGHKVTVWNRDTAKTMPLEAEGVPVAETPAELTRATEVVILMVTGPQAIEEILAGSDGLLAGDLRDKCLINMSTIPPAVSRSLAERLLALGIEFIDAPVSGSRKPAEDGTLVILAGGHRNAVSKYKPLLLCMGRKVVYCGHAGSGSSMKLAVNLLLATLMEGLCEAVNLGRRCGLETERILETILSGPMGCDYFRMKSELIRTGEYAPQFPFKHMHKDLGFILQTAKECGANVPLTRSNMTLFEEGMRQGFSDLDFAAIMKLIEADD